MQQICYLLNIHQSLIPVYHPQANPVERKNRDLKPRLAILVQDKHDCWSEKLPFIRFALNTAKCETTGQTAAFLNFGRELRTPSEVVNDIRVIIQNDNFVPEITPYLKKFTKFSTQIREAVEEQQDSRKFYADKKRKAAPTYEPGEHVFVASHPLSSAAQGRRAKLMPRTDGPYVILTQRSPSSYEIASLDNPGEPLGVYHTSALTPCNNDKWPEEDQKAFQTLKQCLVSSPILKQADFSKPFLIRTGASNYALGAVLLQGEDKEEHPVEFASRLLNPAERNYSTTELEALAVVWAPRWAPVLTRK
ncbi:integrase catalytic domain-containing protein [Trichonephila clavipes]|nr:integrase catalytic domain-containing protein [Trichonephila clavipes]